MPFPPFPPLSSMSAERALFSYFLFIFLVPNLPRVVIAESLSLNDNSKEWTGISRCRGST